MGRFVSCKVYIDYNATAPLHPDVRKSMEPFWNSESTNFLANASSIHWAGQYTRKILEQQRSQMAKLLHCSASEVIFTSGGTEADNLALRGVLKHPTVETPRLLVSKVEHPAIIECAKVLAKQGVDVDYIELSSNGQIDLDDLKQKLATPTTLVSIMAVNNETGIIHDIQSIHELTQDHGALLHVDAVQAPGRIPIPDQVELLTISGHKLGGLVGAGALINRGAKLLPHITGGPQERGRRAGTESVFAIISLASALAISLTDQDDKQKNLSIQSERLESFLATLQDVKIINQSPRVAGVTCAIFEGCEGDILLQALDLAGIAASSGSACSSGSLEPSHVLKALGYSNNQALSAIRFSLGWATTPSDIDRVLEVLPDLLHQTRI